MGLDPHEVRSAVTPEPLPPGTALLVLEDHWLCALLRAELLERARDADCAPTLAIGLLQHREATRVILIDHTVLAGADRDALRVLATVDEGVRILLLSGGALQAPVGPWDAVVRRPVEARDLLGVVSRALDGALPRRHPNGKPPPEWIALRRGFPWPMIRCEGCNVARHYELPRGPHEVGRVAGDAAEFVLEHAPCGHRAEGLRVGDDGRPTPVVRDATRP